MASKPLPKENIKRIGVYPAPNLSGYNSLFFHELTKGQSTSTYKDWGKQIAVICEAEGITYYHFYNDFNIKINVYPNDIIERWYHDNQQ